MSQFEQPLYDFGGWATKNDLICSDGRVIRTDAFKNNDGTKVPIVWNHLHGEQGNILGHGILENRPEGVYVYGKFNDTETGLNAKKLVRHGDISALSIFANQLKQVGNDVIHGVIREVSLVWAGANPGAKIETVLEHSEGFDEEAIIHSGEDLIIQHAEDNKPDKKEGEKEDSSETYKDVFETLTPKQQDVVLEMVAQVMVKSVDEDIEQSEPEKKEEDFKEMKHNVFEGKVLENDKNTLSHEELNSVLSDARKQKAGSLKDIVLAHGITDIEFLFPEARTLTNVPVSISRDMGWVARVMSSVGKTPFSRIKSLFADITEDEARARGYIKGRQKKEEIFTLLKRTTSPQTIYKLQKMDRDDVIDITDFDVVAWIKAEMRVMLDEELARAILIGDGRPTSSDDKIQELNIRPVWKDDDLYTIKRDIGVTASSTEDEIAKAFIRNTLKARVNYRGSGNPVLYTTDDMLTNMLLLEDTTGRIIYDSTDKLKTALRVTDIITVEVMSGVTRTRQADGVDVALLGLIVNLADYKVGADRGGAVNLFDDFDLDFNKYTYLIETRCSGALVKPFSAIALEMVKPAA